MVLTKLIHAISEKDAQDKIKQLYEGKKNLTIYTCVLFQNTEGSYKISFSYDD